MAAGEQAGRRGSAPADAGDSGQLVVAPRGADLPEGSVVTLSGRVSQAVEFVDESRANQPFSSVELSRLDEALTLASRDTGLRFSVYLGELGTDPARRAGELHAGLEAAPDAVLVAVSPGERVVEVITGQAARVRLPDRGAKLAVMSMVASFKEGDLVGGLLSGLRMLADQVGGPRRTV